MNREKQYVKVYFRVETGYVWGSGHTEAQRQAFHQELKQLFPPLGFQMVEPTHSYVSYTAERGRESLYCHPMDLSGHLRPSTIPLVEAALSASNIQLTGVDLYGEYVDEGEDFLKSELQTHHYAALKKRLFTDCQTKRRTHFVSTRGFFAKSPVQLLDKDLTDEVYTSFVSSAIQTLVACGLLVPNAEDDTYVRSLNRTEVKHWEKQHGPLDQTLAAPWPPQA